MLQQQKWRYWWALILFFNICFENYQRKLLSSLVHFSILNLCQFLLLLSLYTHLQTQEFPPFMGCPSKTSAFQVCLMESFFFSFLLQADGLTDWVLFYLLFFVLAKWCIHMAWKDWAIWLCSNQLPEFTCSSCSGYKSSWQCSESISQENELRIFPVRLQ